MADLNGAIKPRLSALYDQSSPLLSKRGRQIAERAIRKGTVGGDVGMQLLFEPAMVLSLVAAEDVLHEVADVAKDIPFIGNYNQWLPAGAAIAAAYRALVTGNDYGPPTYRARAFWPRQSVRTVSKVKRRQRFTSSARMPI
ncbi:hypothetical protein [Mycobacterium sp. D16Q16]|uniref:hypothetical protein n=1 Tax=Mycobacterium sp. D16Q16 TaxID=1855659 RepID=UPI00257073EC|nr:hypothetical protein [Mycobacterium sp. D16Q16]